MNLCQYPKGDGSMLWKVLLDQIGVLAKPMLDKIIQTVLKNLLDQLSKNMPNTQMSTYVDTDKVAEDSMKELLS